VPGDHVFLVIIGGAFKGTERLLSSSYIYGWRQSYASSNKQHNERNTALDMLVAPIPGASLTFIFLIFIDFVFAYVSVTIFSISKVSVFGNFIN
jgi:hypothetical protein